MGRMEVLSQPSVEFSSQEMQRLQASEALDELGPALQVLNLTTAGGCAPLIVQTQEEMQRLALEGLAILQVVDASREERCRSTTCTLLDSAFLHRLRGFTAKACNILHALMVQTSGGGTDKGQGCMGRSSRDRAAAPAKPPGCQAPLSLGCQHGGVEAAAEQRVSAGHPRSPRPTQRSPGDPGLAMCSPKPVGRTACQQTVAARSAHKIAEAARGPTPSAAEADAARGPTPRPDRAASPSSQLAMPSTRRPSLVSRSTSSSAPRAPASLTSRHPSSTGSVAVRAVSAATSPTYAPTLPSTPDMLGSPAPSSRLACSLQSPAAASACSASAPLTSSSLCEPAAALPREPVVLACSLPGTPRVRSAGASSATSQGYRAGAAHRDGGVAFSSVARSRPTTAAVSNLSPKLLNAMREERTAAIALQSRAAHCAAALQAARRGATRSRPSAH